MTKTDSSIPSLSHAISCDAEQVGQELEGSVKSSRKVIALICRELVNESWLPIGLRSQIAEEVMQLSKRLGSADFELESCGEMVRNLELVVRGYGDLAMESEVVRLISEWSQELTCVSGRSAIRLLRKVSSSCGELQFAS